VLRAMPGATPSRAALIELAGQDVPLGQVLERRAQATPGGRWSTGGMIGGSGHGCVRA
jgi:phage terminase large subunit-like protein